MSTDEQLPAMIAPDVDDPRILDAIWLVAIADVDDLDEVTDVVLSRTVEMQVNEGLPVYVVGNWPPERVREYLRRQPSLPPIDPEDPFPFLSA